MKIRFYLRVIGPENAIRAFNDDAAWPHATMKSLRRGVEWPPKEGSDPSWCWQTMAIEAKPDEFEKAFAQFLQQCSSLAEKIAGHRNSLNWASCVIVEECEDSELPSGLHFSPEMIEGMRRLGVDLDIDVVRALH